MTYISDLTYKIFTKDDNYQKLLMKKLKLKIRQRSFRPKPLPIGTN